MYSNAYYQTVDRVKQYHLKKDIYSGVATVHYRNDIKELVDKHNAKSRHPDEGAKFDGIIVIQSLAGIPDADFPIVVNQLMQMTNKFCFIGTKLTKGKASKGDPTLDKYFKADRLDPDWWKEQFKGWQGSELVLKFIE